MTPALRRFFPALMLLFGCHQESPPEAPPPAGCGPGMAEARGPGGAPLCVDQARVTVAAYEECIGRGLCSARPAGSGCLRDDLTTQQLPVNCVDVGQADAFCKAQRKRLPSREELQALPLQPNEGLRWGSDQEWTSTRRQPTQALAVSFQPQMRSFFAESLLPPETQRADLGFRCIR
ncbi:MAG: hypothetical protein MUF64_18405 [Polyangiaceae bacterium]|nr:hypothetical protein [Polyangiaceae bacterium]